MSDVVYYRGRCMYVHRYMSVLYVDGVVFWWWRLFDWWGGFGDILGFCPPFILGRKISQFVVFSTGAKWIFL